MSKEIMFEIASSLEIGCTVVERGGGFIVEDLTLLLSIPNIEIELVYLLLPQKRLLEDLCIKHYLEEVDNG